MAEGIRIDQLPSTVNPSLAHEFTAMKDGLTVKLSLDQLRALIAAIYDPQEIAADAFSRSNHTGEQEISTITGLADALDANVRVDLAQSFLPAEQEQARENIGIDYWQGKAIGEPFALWDHMSGLPIPPKGQFIKLTAGLTGAGGYNEGLLSSENVSGSFPLVIATATISDVASPLYGQIVSLINSEGRFIRASTSSGSVQNDAIQDHTHNRNSGGLSELAVVTGTGYADPSAGTTRSLTPATKTGAVTDARTAAETRVKNIGATYYMRIK